MESKRTFLRRLRATDFDNMRLLESDPEVVQFTPMRVPQSEQQTQDRLNSQIKKQRELDPFGIWLSEEKQGGDCIGWFMLFPVEDKVVELGFMLSRAKWGQGFATEVSQLLIDFAQKNGVSRVTARTSPVNNASIHILEKSGFRFTKNISITEQGFDEKVELKFFELPFDP